MTTGVKTDLSIEGEGYFQVQREEANGWKNKSTNSSGNFYINSDEELVTSQGYNVLNDAGQRLRIYRLILQLIVRVKLLKLIKMIIRMLLLQLAWQRLTTQLV